MDNELYHHGIRGQKWGVRRYQNPDGTLTDAGKKRYIRQQTAVGATAGTFLGGYSGAIAAGILSGSIAPASIPVSMITGALLGGSAGGIAFGKSQYRASKEATKGKVLDEDLTPNLMEATQDHRDFKEAWENVKKSGYLDSYPKEIQKGLKKAARKSYNFDEFDDRIISKYGDHPGDVVYEAMEDIRYKRERGAKQTQAYSNVHMNNVMLFNQRAIRDVHMNNVMLFNQQAIRDANVGASLSISGGTNPYVFV